LPVAPIHDLVVKEGDIIVATHGRGFWVLDDITPLRQITPEILSSSVHLFAPRRAYRFRERSHLYPDVADITKSHEVTWPFPVFELPSGTTYYLNAISGDGAGPSFHDAGQNPPNGVTVHYYLKEAFQSAIELSFRNSSGEVVRSFSSSGERRTPTGNATDPLLPTKAGLNRFCWDMRYPSSVGITDAEFAFPSDPGPLAIPGSYTASLTVGPDTYRQAFVIDADPRVSTSNPDLAEQLALLIRVRDKVTDAHRATNQIRTIRRQVNEWIRRTGSLKDGETILQHAERLNSALLAVEEELVQTRIRGTEDALNFPPKLNRRLSMLGRCLAAGDWPPTSQSYAVFEYLSGLLDRELARLDEVIRSELRGFVELLSALGVPAVAVNCQPLGSGPVASSD